MHLLHVFFRFTPSCGFLAIICLLRSYGICAVLLIDNAPVIKMRSSGRNNFTLRIYVFGFRTYYENDKREKKWGNYIICVGRWRRINSSRFRMSNVGRLFQMDFKTKWSKTILLDKVNITGEKSFQQNFQFVKLLKTCENHKKGQKKLKKTKLGYSNDFRASKGS